MIKNTFLRPAFCAGIIMILITVLSCRKEHPPLDNDDNDDNTINDVGCGTISDADGHS